jgi:hypothetical protein
MRLWERGAYLFRVRAVTALQKDTGKIADGQIAGSWIRWVLISAILALLACSAAPSLKHALAGPFPTRIDPFHSSNLAIEAATGSANVSERIVEVMAYLPPGKPLLIFEQERSARSILLGMTLAYLAWPREVRFETVKGPRCEEQVSKITPGSVGGMAFCNLPCPPWTGGGLRLGPDGTLIVFPSAAGKSR